MGNQKFHANLVVKKYNGCSDVHFTLFKHRLTEAEIAEIPQLIKHPEDIGKSVDAHGKVWEGHEPYIESLVEELFTQEEVDAMRPYFEEFPETTFESTEVELPIETRGYMGVGAIPVGGPQDFYMFSEAKDYPLPFKVYGYYDLRHTKEWDELPELDVFSQKNPNPEFRNTEDVNYSGGMLCAKCGNLLEGGNSREVPLDDNRENLGYGILVHYKLPGKEDWYANYCNACFNRLNIVKHPEPEAK